ncbi:hypothetical protein [Flavobacterium sp.]|uniref:hypothetical protein n=1 Tax=Flavobacterium sp. TaxID=239 RepID=UPI002D064C0E|nr:hypothetical protein [Flavobacterium sp.]HSD07664.1 hypothetical protein [Flavobacterium sp.]
MYHKIYTIKKLKTAFTVLLCLIYTIINAQEKEPKLKLKEVANFEIRDGRSNGTDITPKILENNMHLVLCEYPEINEIYLFNTSEKSDSKSYGRIYSVTKEETPEDENFYKCQLYQFRWSYINTYDKKEGTAKVEIFVTYKPQGVYYELTILPENLNVLVYKGLMTGDLSELDSNIKK